MLKTFTIATAACLVLATPLPAVAQDGGHEVRFMGDLTCGGWRAAPASYTSMQKAALLNWVLGFLSGRTAERGDDILATVEISSIAAWVDDYCARNPLNYLVTAAFDLERALLARRRGD